MTIKCTQFFAACLCAMIGGLISVPLSAHPLPGRDLLKFSQLPMDTTPVMGTIYHGHDELSTAYAPIGLVPTVYRGDFMADDFADTLSTPVVHVKWWGSYLNNSEQFGHINKFLIAFESDVPTPNGLGFSYPDPNGPIHSQIVSFTNGPLTPASGTFTETFISPGGPPLGEHLYEYNAELAIPFPQQKDTVHWLKIVALVDHPPTIQPGPNAPLPAWGWHNRDYTKKNPSLYVSGVPVPGEHNQGNAALFPIWHFQDDAVSGKLDVNIISPTSQQVIQHLPTFDDEFYVDGWDGPPAGVVPGFNGISSFSKDLAFELYTVVPEPTGLAILGCCFLAATGWRPERRR
jgi:hypothetical protein